MSASALRDALRERRSYPAVTQDAPSPAQLRELVALAATVADHAALSPWRVIELRGEARERLGAAISAAALRVGQDEAAAAKLAAKPLRAPLLLALVASRRFSLKVPAWEQDAVAAGVGHILSLLLDDAGWGVMWRTGVWTRQPEVAEAHGLGQEEELLGWLYVGGRPEDEERGVARRGRLGSSEASEKVSAL